MRGTQTVVQRATGTERQTTHATQPAERSRAAKTTDPQPAPPRRRHIQTVGSRAVTLAGPKSTSSTSPTPRTPSGVITYYTHSVAKASGVDRLSGAFATLAPMVRDYLKQRVFDRSARGQGHPAPPRRDGPWGNRGTKATLRRASGGGWTESLVSGNDRLRDSEAACLPDRPTRHITRLTFYVMRRVRDPAGVTIDKVRGGNAELVQVGHRLVDRL